MRKPRHPGSGFIPVDRPVGAVDLDDWAQADYALEQAQDCGNFKPLCERLRTAMFLFPEERVLAADIIAGVWKRPPHRIAQNPDNLSGMEFYLALCVLTLRLEGVSHKQAVHQVIQEYKVSNSKVRKSIRKNKSLFGNLLPKRGSGK